MVSGESYLGGSVSDDELRRLQEDIQRLKDIEDIKRLKALYFECVDTQD